MTDRDLLLLGNLIEAMGDRYDHRLSDEQFVLRAASTLDSLDPAARQDPGLATAVRALEDFLNSARDARLPLGIHGPLRSAVAELPLPAGWQAHGPWRTFSLRVLQASWGIAIDLKARSAHCDTFPPDAIPASDKVALVAGDVKLGTEDIAQLLHGMGLMARAIQRARPNAHVLVELGAVTFTPTDYQPEGLAAAIIGWSAEEFGVAQVSWDLRYDKTTNRYILWL